VLKRHVRDHTAVILRHPAAFMLRAVRGFRANQGLLLAGAVAYYALLSLIPLLILLLIGLSHVIDQTRLLNTLAEYLEFVAPGASLALVDDLRTFLAHREVGGLLLAAMLLSSALAFTVLENAMSVIFVHRVVVRRRRFIVSAMLPDFFILSLGLGLLVVTVVAGRLSALATYNARLSAYLLYLMGVAGEIMMLTAIYLVMPSGRPSWRHALIGGVTAAVLWEITRHILVWYYSTMSQIKVVYGSLTTAIAVLLSVEIAAIVLLFGAQVIAEYERILREPVDAPPTPMHT
jgi:membrane protein